VQAALHQSFGLAGSDELDRLGGRGMAVFRVDQLKLSDIETALLSGAANTRDRTDKNRFYQPELRRLDRPAQGTSSHGCATATLRPRDERYFRIYDSKSRSRENRRD